MGLILYYHICIILTICFTNIFISVTINIVNKLNIINVIHLINSLIIKLHNYRRLGNMHSIQKEIEHYINWCNKHNLKVNNAYSLQNYFNVIGGVSKC